MAKLDRNSVMNRIFSDKQHFPYGFSRSGDFSIRESQQLEKHGCLYAALIDGELPPETEDDQAFLTAANGQGDSSNPVHRVWIKYQTLINRPRAGSIYGHNKPQVEEDSTTEESLSLPLEDDEPIED